MKYYRNVHLTTCIILLSNVTPIKLIKVKKRENNKKRVPHRITQCGTVVTVIKASFDSYLEVVTNMESLTCYLVYTSIHVL